MLTRLAGRAAGDGHGVADARPYAMGYSDREFRRLELQGAFLRDLTEDVLRRAGIAPGMRVLDIGCGVGDVSLLAAALVDPSGEVLGLDRSAEAIGIATRRAVTAGQDRVRFTAAELDAFATDETFDALIGRFILAFLRDPAVMLRRLCRQLRPGGIVAFQEAALPLARSVPDGPQFRRCIGWILDSFGRAGCDPDMGGRLFATFLAAGLPEPRMIAAARVEGGPHSLVYDYVAEALRSLVLMAERTGVATAAEIDIDTMADRLREEAIAHRACIMPPLLVGAWTRTPA